MPLSQSVLQSRLDFALRAAAEAGSLIMSHYQSPELAVDRKRDSSPVTIADRGAEELIRDMVASTYPGDGVLGEEFGETEGTSGWRWVLDPVDGTKSFIHGVPLFGTLIGLEHEDEQAIGVCSFPALGETVYAGLGLGAFWKIGDSAPRPSRVSAVEKLSEATFCTTTLQGWHRINRQSTFDAFCDRTAISRGWGDCYGHALVATGRADVMIDPLLNAWDAAALVPIMKEAGGHFLDLDGKVSIHSGNGLSVNDGLKEAVINVIREFA